MDEENSESGEYECPICGQTFDDSEDADQCCEAKAESGVDEDL